MKLDFHIFINGLEPWALGFTQPLTEMSTGNIKKKMFLGIKVRPVLGADNLTAVYELIVWTMRVP
jgi:hypothetical protein